MAESLKRLGQLHIIMLHLHHYDSSAPSIPFCLQHCCCCSCTNYKFRMIPAAFYIESITSSVSSMNSLPPLRLTYV